MPLYEYVCPQCHTEYEVRLTFSQCNSTALCPKCQADGQKLISSFACKTGGNIQASEKAFRRSPASGTRKSSARVGSVKK